MTTTNAPVDGDKRYDVVVVGGGAAGLSGALTLARARRSVLVIDAGRPRNAPASSVHNYLGREGTPPVGAAGHRPRGGDRLRRRDRGRHVVAAERLEDGGFRVDARGRVRGRWPAGCW